MNYLSSILLPILICYKCISAATPWYLGGSSIGASEQSTRRIIALILCGIAGIGLTALFGVALARSMSPAEFGEFSAARGMLGLTTIIATMGFGDLVMNFLPSAMRDSEFARARGILHFAPRLIAAVGLLVAVIIVVLHWAIKHDSIVEVEHFAAVMLLLPIAGIQAFLAGAASALGAAVPSALVTSVAMPGLTLVILYIFRFAEGANISVMEAAIVWGGALALDCWLSLRVLKRFLGDDLKQGERETEPRAWVKAALPYLSTVVVLVWLDVGGMIVIGWVHTDPEAAARFSAASQLSSFALILGLVTAPLYLPDLARAIHDADAEEVRQLLRRRNRIIIPATLVVAVALVALAQPLLHLYGPTYGAAEWTLIALVVGKTANAVFALCLPEIQYRGKNALAVKILATFFVISVAAMVGMGLLYSDTGVGIAQGASLTLAMIVVQWALVRLRKQASTGKQPEAGKRPPAQ